MTLQGDGFKLRPIMGDPEEMNEILEVYRQSEDFLALGPQPVASMAMVWGDMGLAEKNGGCLLAIVDDATGRAVGVLDYLYSGYEGKPEQAYLELLMIAAPSRGKGLGEKVFRFMEEDIRQDGRARVLCAGVQANNPGAIRFWKRMGFQIVSGPEPLDDGTVCYALSKDLHGEQA